MASNDLPLWDRYRLLYASEFIGFYFDSALGTPSSAPVGTEEGLVRMWTRITSKRIDVVGRKLGAWWIIELRPQASSGALGTILTYRDIWLSDPPDSDPVTSVIVTDFPDPDLLILAAKNDIQIVVV